MHHERDPFRLSNWFHPVDDILKYLTEDERLLRHRGGIALKLSEIEQIIDETLQTFRFPFDDLVILRTLFFLQRIILHHLCIATNVGERCPQFMTDVRKDLPPLLVDFPKRFRHLIQSFCEFANLIIRLNRNPVIKVTLRVNR